jgi:hypothetical protein
VSQSSAFEPRVPTAHRSYRGILWPEVLASPLGECPARVSPLEARNPCLVVIPCTEESLVRCPILFDTPDVPVLSREGHPYDLVSLVSYAQQHSPSSAPHDVRSAAIKCPIEGVLTPLSALRHAILWRLDSPYPRDPRTAIGNLVPPKPSRTVGWRQCVAGSLASPTLSTPIRKWATKPMLLSQAKEWLGSVAPKTSPLLGSPGAYSASVSERGKPPLCPFRVVVSAPGSSVVHPVTSREMTTRVCRAFLSRSAASEAATLPEALTRLPLVTEAAAAFSRWSVATPDWLDAYRLSLVEVVRARSSELEEEAASLRSTLEAAIHQHKAAMHKVAPERVSAASSSGTAWGGDSMATRERLFGVSEEARRAREAQLAEERKREIESAGSHAMHLSGRVQSVEADLEACRKATELLKSSLRAESVAATTVVLGPSELDRWVAGGELDVFVQNANGESSFLCASSATLTCMALSGNDSLTPPTVDDDGVFWLPVLEVEACASGDATTALHPAMPVAAPFHLVDCGFQVFKSSVKSLWPLAQSCPDQAWALWDLVRRDTARGSRKRFAASLHRREGPGPTLAEEYADHIRKMGEHVSFGREFDEMAAIALSQGFPALSPTLSTPASEADPPAYHLESDTVPKKQQQGAPRAWGVATSLAVSGKGRFPSLGANLSEGGAATQPRAPPSPLLEGEAPLSEGIVPVDGGLPPARRKGRKGRFRPGER